MKYSLPCILAILFGLSTISCVSKKKFTSMQQSLSDELEASQERLSECQESVRSYASLLSTCEEDKKNLESQLSSLQQNLSMREEQVDDLRNQLDKQYEQVGDLTVLTQAANENIRETLSQLEKKDEYISLLQAAKSKTDSINLALAVNLKQVLANGIEDEDVEVKVDKTVVMINISDKMLYQSGSARINSRAGEVLSKIAEIIKSRPELDVMVEGYTDNVPISTNCIKDNWDLSVMRATSVVRALQEDYGVDPNKLIAAGRGEYNTLVSNDTAENRSINRRTRIILLPKLGQFYDLLNPNNMPKAEAEE